jgi:carboxymethylenebutenolidase
MLMTVRVLMVAALLAGAVPGPAVPQQIPPDAAGAVDALNASPRHGEWASVRLSDGDSVRVWVAYPERSEPAPVVVVIHEIYGLTHWIRAVADRLAADGFVALAPDMLTMLDVPTDATGEPDRQAATAAIRTLDPGRIQAMISAVAGHGMTLPGALDRYATLGFCWGGAASFEHASRAEDRLLAAVVFYGTSPEAASLTRVRVPVLGLYGEDDARVNATIPRARDALGDGFTARLYDGAGHGFLRQQTGRDGANLRASEQAWPETLRFLRNVAAGATGAPPDSDIFLLDLRREDGGFVVSSAPRAVTNRPGYDNQPLFTHDGDALLYTSIRHGQADTWRYDIPGERAAQVTRTPESEYSPTPMPGSDRFSVVRVEADGSQRLWSFAPDGSDPRLVLPDLAPVGYHAWVGPRTLALFVLGEPPTLQIAEPGPGPGRVVASRIGRAIQTVPGGAAVTFTQQVDGEWWLMELNVTTGALRPVTRLLGPDGYHAHTPQGDILAAHGQGLFQLVEGAGWVEIADLSTHGLGTLTRIAVSPDGRRLAVVVE